MHSYQFNKGLHDSIGRVMDQAHRLEAPVSTVIVDGGGHMVAFLRHFNARLISCTTAIGKARCAIMFARDSVETEKIAQDNPIAFQSFVEASELPFVIGGGGYFVEKHGVRFGIGVAGATPDLDEFIGEMLYAELLKLMERTLGDSPTV